jgi:2-hydroxychromene-2-carboxylate isomerase
MAPSVRINDFTDPACPWAYSAEPVRIRLQWLYEGEIEWIPRMVVLSDSAGAQARRGLTPERLSAALHRIARDHRMPIDTGARERVAASRPACLGVVAVRAHAGPEAAERMLRELRVRTFAGDLLDDPGTIAGAAAAAGVEPSHLHAWTAEPDVEDELRRDMHDARRPMPAARVLDHKLANWSGGRRYTCPSYEITRLNGGVTISVPGFQPFAAYDVILANLVPGLERRSPPTSVEEVLAWAGEPLATQEVAAVCCIEFDEARQQLGRVAEERHVGADGFWTLRAAGATP